MSFLCSYFDLIDDTREQAVICPFPHHLANGQAYQESHASASVNTEKGLFHCKACGRGYNETQFIQEILGCEKYDALKIEQAFSTDEELADWTEVERTQETTETALSLGINEETLNELRVATPDNEVSTLAFPVLMYNHLCDIRMYNPKMKPKCRSREGSHTGFIIPFDIWNDSPKNRWTFLCAGEKDMAVARSHGLNAITLTGGEQMRPLFLKPFEGRRVVIVYDNDDTGKAGAKKIATMLYGIAETVKICTGFHEVCNQKGEDITDFFVKYHRTKRDLINYVEKTEPFVPSQDIQELVELPIVTLFEASKPKNIGKMMRSNIQVISTADETYVCPSSTELVQTGEPQANSINILQPGQRKLWELTEDNAEDVLHLIDNNFTEDKVKENMCKINHLLPKGVKINIKEQVTFYKATVTDMYETSDNIQSQPTEYTVYSVNQKLESGKKYMIIYKLVPHPYKGQQLIGIATRFRTAEDSVSDFKITPSVIEHLKLIQTDCDEGANIKQKVTEQVERVKGILGYNGNSTLIAAIDLAFNTALQFDFGRFKNVRGYLDTFIISESRVGKSSTADALRRTYELGAITSLAGNSATIPGLIGGSNKTTTGFQTRAGVIPQNHKGLIIFEEFGKSDHKIASELTDIRSSNEVRIARVSGTVTMPALVRMITLTNPKTINGQIKSIASYPNGFSILTDLVETAEDIARYDMVVILADKGASEIDPLWEPAKPYPQEVYKDRIRWIWSRTPEQILMDTDTQRYIVQKANELNRDYECHIKLFGTECWKKVARLAIAVAGYCVSADESFENIIVKKEHIDFAVDFFKELYDNSTFKLKEYVENERKYSTIDDEGVVRLQEIYDKAPMLVLHLEQNASTSRTVLQSVTGLSSDDLSKSLNGLTKGLFVKFSGYDIIPTERFRLGLSRINRNTHVNKLGETPC